MNLARSHFRRLAIARRYHDQQATSSPAPPPVESEDSLVLRAAVRELPQRQRAALLLRYFADLSVRDAATAMRCSEGTVKSLTSDALTGLRRNPALAGWDDTLATGAPHDE
jgi:RNA polymerase sigma factor (sigma-70 family)